MSSTDDGQFIQGSTMNAVADAEVAHSLLGRLEAIEARRRGASVRSIRNAIAERLRALPGTLENLRRLRLKTVPNWLMTRLRAELVITLQAEIMRLEHEVSIHRQIGSDPREDDLAKAEAALVAAREILKG